MKIMPLFLALLALAAPAYAAERRYAVTDFDRVIVEGPFVVRLVPGRTSTAVARGEQRALEALTVDSQGKTLRIRRNRSSWGGYPGRDAAGPVVVELATRNLRSARLVGPGRLEIEGAKGMEIELVLQGGGQISASGIEADKLSLGLVGSGRMDVAGTVEAVAVNVDGSGNIDAGRLRAENVTVTAATAGTVTVAASETAVIDANGVGTVQVIGRPDCTVRGLAAGMVRCGPSNQR